jgi:hypothetical protein
MNQFTAAEPGVRTYLELPLVAGRAAASLRGADGASSAAADPDLARRTAPR